MFIRVIIFSSLQCLSASEFPLTQQGVPEGGLCGATSKSVMCSSSWQAGMQSYTKTTQGRIKFTVPEDVNEKVSAKSTKQTPFELFASINTDVVSDNVGFLVNDCTLNQAKLDTNGCYLRGKHHYPHAITDATLNDQKGGHEYNACFYGAQLGKLDVVH